jgi:drug/metabolite transporter (DMT)-like permease
VDSLSALCCVVGMLLITRPPLLFPSAQPSKPVNALGVLAGLVSALSAAGVNLTIRRLKSETAATITLYAMLGSVLVVLPGLLWKQVAHSGGGGGIQPRPLLLLQLCLTGLLSWLAQMTKTSGLKMSKSLVSQSAELHEDRTGSPLLTDCTV